MNVETATRINSAACNLYFYKYGLRSWASVEDIRLMHSVTQSQIETAVEIVEAINRDAKSVDGKTKYLCTPAVEIIPVILCFAAQLEA